MGMALKLKHKMVLQNDIINLKNASRLILVILISFIFIRGRETDIINKMSKSIQASSDIEPLKVTK